MSENEASSTSLTLLHRVEGDDGEAWGTFVQLYGPVVYAWCRSAGVQPEDADDVGQEVFRVVAQKLGTFEPGRKSSGAFRSWLWGITRNQILQYLRSSKRQPTGHGGTDHNLVLQRIEKPTPEPEDPGGGTSRQVLLRSAIGILRAQFDPRTWQAFWDMAVKGRPAKDIGEELEMTPKAVRQAKFRVTKKLRDLVDEDLAELAGIQTESLD